MSESPKSTRTSNIEGIVAWAAAIGICLFAHLGAIGLVGPDEPRYVWIARAMATSGDWITPRLYGQPWFEKPVLYYWLAAVGFLLHLPVEYAARLPSAVGALAVAIALGWLAFKHYGMGERLLATPVFLAPLLFSSSVAAIGFARAATPDMLFSACIALAMAATANILRRSGKLRTASTPVPHEMKSAITSPVLLGAFLGLAVLAKGPAALLIAGGALALWAIATRQWDALLLFCNHFTLVASCLVALPWYAVCAMRNPNFLYIFILQHNFERYLTPLFQHRQPFWFFGPIVVLAVLPWAALLWPAARRGWQEWRNGSARQSPGFFFACWAAFPIFFFSFSQSKLPSYILPSIAPISLILARAFAQLLGNTSPAGRKTSKILGFALGITWLILGIAALIWRARLTPTARDDAGRAILILGLIAILCGIAITVLSIRRRGAPILASVALVMVLLEGASMCVLPALDPYYSARWHAEFLRNDAHPDRVFTYHLPRSWDYGLAFYLARGLPEWSPEHREAALVLTTPSGLREMEKLGRVSGTIDETYKGILYVPAYPAPF